MIRRNKKGARCMAPKRYTLVIFCQSKVHPKYAAGKLLHMDATPSTRRPFCSAMSPRSPVKRHRPHAARTKTRFQRYVSSTVCVGISGSGVPCSGQKKQGCSGSRSQKSGCPYSGPTGSPVLATFVPCLGEVDLFLCPVRELQPDRMPIRNDVVGTTGREWTRPVGQSCSVDNQNRRIVTPGTTDKRYAVYARRERRTAHSTQLARTGGHVGVG